jgi:hypothetical protein
MLSVLRLGRLARERPLVVRTSAVIQVHLVENRGWYDREVIGEAPVLPQLDQLLSRQQVTKERIEPS